MISVSAIIQILILYVAIYAVLKRARGSRFGQVLMGVGVLAALAAVFTYVLQFDVLSEIIRLVLGYLALSTVVIFQPEIRRMLAAVGAMGRLERPHHDREGSADPEYVIATLLALSDAKLGGLFAIERGISLGGYEATGVMIDALFTRELVTSILTPPLPLHDGGITLRCGRLSAAHCVFPVSNNPELPVSGMRHRAAVGLSEETDALVIVVSEESGAISVAHNGRISRYEGDQREIQLRRWLSRAMALDPRHRRTLGWLVGFLQRRRRPNPVAPAANTERSPA